MEIQITTKLKIMRSLIFYILLISADLKFAYSVKVSLKGSLSLGKDVMGALSDFFRENYYNGRRSLRTLHDEDYITDIVRTAALCRDLTFCLTLRKFVDEYIIVSAKSTEVILSNTLKDRFNLYMFEKYLKKYLFIVRYILEEANTEMNDDKDPYYWTNAIKKICAKFQEMSSLFILETLQYDIKAIKTLDQKIIVTTALIELEYLKKLCNQHNICNTSYKITKSLKNIFQELGNMSDKNVRSFILNFNKALFDTNFYSHLNEITAHELQVILNDMAYSSEVPTNEILSMVKRVIDLRIESIKLNNDINLPYEELLLHSILSDMDHIYSKNKQNFGNFFHNFYDWTKSEIRFNKEINHVLRKIGQELSTISDDLFIKIKNEVRVFLELTVDPQ